MVKEKKDPLYQEIANHIISLIDKGTLKAGDKIPSIRKFSNKMKVSINTIKEAYSLLEIRRLIEARPQSGYYVCAKWPEIHDDSDISECEHELKPTDATIDEIVYMFIKDMTNPNLINIGTGDPNPEQLPRQKLHRILSAEIRKFEINNLSYIPNSGLERLRKEIAKLYIPLGLSLTPDDIVITSGCKEAMIISLLAVCKPGDTVAMASPFFPCCCLILGQLGLNLIEIPSHPKTGINPDTLEYVIENNKIKACFLIPNYNNPIGSLMPKENRKKIVEILVRNDVTLIEDDIYGDLSHKGIRPNVLKYYNNDSVILCSSFSKSIAPGFRIGWAFPGKYKKKFEQLKLIMHNTSASYFQLTMAEFLENGGFDRYIRKAQRIYVNNMAIIADSIGKYFPEGTRTTQPEGGYFLWVVMPKEVDSIKLYEMALEKNISIAPGPIFTATDKYKNCFRLNASLWSPKIEHALITLGQLAAEQI